MNIDIIPDTDLYWSEVFRFSRTYDGYQRFSRFHPGRSLQACSRFANRFYQKFLNSGELPTRLDDLRTCLFFEMERRRHELVPKNYRDVESRCGAVADAPFPHPAHRTRTCGFPASGSRTRKHRTPGPVGRRLRILNWNREVHRFAPLSLSFSSVSGLLELRSLPSTGVTRLPRYYEPVRHPKRPGLSLAGVRLGSRFPPLGLPVLQQLPMC
jgi:hypothetical protein